MRTAGLWAYFALVQLLSFAAQLVGLVLLAPFCLAQAWTGGATTNKVWPAPWQNLNGRSIDRWSFAPLNLVYGNPEDGVSGQQALIWNATGQLVPFMPGAWAPWRAYCWSAWRNSADNLKYVFRLNGGPFVRFTLGPWTFHAGWLGNGLPTIGKD